jgi:hypothetical protein
MGLLFGRGEHMHAEGVDNSVMDGDRTSVLDE